MVLVEKGGYENERSFKLYFWIRWGIIVICIFAIYINVNEQNDLNIAETAFIVTGFISGTLIVCSTVIGMAICSKKE